MLVTTGTQIKSLMRYVVVTAMVPNKCRGVWSCGPMPCRGGHRTQPLWPGWPDVSVPETVLVYAYYPFIVNIYNWLLLIIINHAPFPSLKCPCLHDQLYGHLLRTQQFLSWLYVPVKFSGSQGPVCNISGFMKLNWVSILGGRTGDRWRIPTEGLCRCEEEGIRWTHSNMGE